jgi:hypothetical protein
MSRSLSPRSARAARRAGALLAAAGALAAPAVASAAPVSEGTLDWSHLNEYTLGPGNTNKTFMGYTTSPMPMLGQGIVGPLPPATGPVVDPASPRGANEWYTYTLPVKGGDWNPDTGVGAVELQGGVAFSSNAHGFVNTVENPLIELHGPTGTLRAWGHMSPTPGQVAQYDLSKPVFNLQVAQALLVYQADGTRQAEISLVPVLAARNNPFNYPVGSGPDRTPNTFGDLKLKLTVRPTPAQQPEIREVPKTVTQTIRKVIVYLKKAPVKGKAWRKVRVYTNTKSPKRVAEGRLRGRVLRVNLADGVKSLRTGAVYKLRVNGVKSTLRVRVPA